MPLLSRRTALMGIAASAGLAKRSLAKPAQLCASVATAPIENVCTPLHNAVPLVQFNGLVNGMALPNVSPFGPSNFSFLLHSSWHCCPPGPGPITGCDLTFSPLDVFLINVAAQAGQEFSCEIQVYQATPFGTKQYDATFNPLPSQQWHVLASVNTNTQVVQLFVNDVQYSPVSGGWTGSGQMPGSPGVGASTVVDVGSSGGSMYPAVADIWEMATPSWVDLTVVANRRKFINTDKSPVDLGANGQTPFGTPPNIYLNASSGVPNDMTINKGSSGGTFTINLSGGPQTLTMQVPGTCPCAT
jgi:hypothetical protein